MCGNDVRESHITNYGTPIALGVTCLARDVLTFEATLSRLGWTLPTGDDFKEKDQCRRWRTRASGKVDTACFSLLVLKSTLLPKKVKKSSAFNCFI
jgi:hypothetical protein